VSIDLGPVGFVGDAYFDDYSVASGDTVSAYGVSGGISLPFLNGFTVKGFFKNASENGATVNSITEGLTRDDAKLDSPDDYETKYGVTADGTIFSMLGVNVVASLLYGFDFNGDALANFGLSFKPISHLIRSKLVDIHAIRLVLALVLTLVTYHLVQLLVVLLITT